MLNFSVWSCVGLSVLRRSMAIRVLNLLLFIVCSDPHSFMFLFYIVLLEFPPRPSAQRRRSLSDRKVDWLSSPLCFLDPGPPLGLLSSLCGLCREVFVFFKVTSFPDSARNYDLLVSRCVLRFLYTSFASRNCLVLSLLCSLFFRLPRAGFSSAPFDCNLFFLSFGL